MEVHQFDKCMLKRLEESMDVLSWKDTVISASQVRLEWAYFIELQIEPAGWQSIWKIPRVICEELGLRYPTVVFGMVEQVLFKELQAVFTIESVQNSDIHLPERHQVALIDLWPTISQENQELNIHRTADCCDRLRFFYTNVWMPWDNDNDDDLNWVEKYLELRIRFCYDLRNKTIKRPLAAHIRTLLTEAKYIQERREYLELDISDEEEVGDTLNKSQVTDLMQLHLRLAMIRSEIEILENPEMRRIYEKVKLDAWNKTTMLKQSDKAEQKRTYHLVTLPCTTEQQIRNLQALKENQLKDSLVQMSSSLQDILNTCNASDQIFLSPGYHAIKFLECLRDDGCISGLVADRNNYDNSTMHEVTITSKDADSILFVFDGNYILENIVLDCQNVRTGILIKSGTVLLKNCKLIGNGESTTQEGIVCMGTARLTMENCTVEKFETGLTLNEGTLINLIDTAITNCTIGMEVQSNEVSVKFQRTKISSAGKCGILANDLELKDVSAKCVKLQNIRELKQLTSADMAWDGECNFKDCQANLIVTNHHTSLFSNNLLKYILSDKGTALSEESDSE